MAMEKLAMPMTNMIAPCKKNAAGNNTFSLIRVEMSMLTPRENSRRSVPHAKSTVTTGLLVVA